MDVQRLELKLSMRRIRVLWLRKHWLTMEAGFAVQTWAPLPSHEIFESYYPWSKPYGQEDHSITDTT